METVATQHSGRVDVAGAQLYYEICGNGPTLLLISGGASDAGQWSGVVPALAQQFMVVTYDRRGYSRSPRPDGWTSTSVMEHADDAAGLLRRLDLAHRSRADLPSGIPG
jgi:pimeloyl-ACP methyl ester carboxylesterase